MILDIADLVVRHCAVAGLSARQLRVAFLKTTEPTFLVFAPHQAHPLYVVKVGDAGTLHARAQVATRLHVLLPGNIAKPAGVFPLEASRALLVQDGLRGIPWFRLGDRYRTPADWRALRGRAIAGLRQFHDAVATQVEWVTASRPLDGELRAMAADLLNELRPVGERVHALIASASDELARIGPVAAVCQHGDFVLNNLLIDDDRLAILDLDDFGKWRAPFVDAFALAHSFHLLAGNCVTWPHLADDLATCAAAERNAAAYSPAVKVAFVVYFLLAAITDTLHKPTRTTIRLKYVAALRDLADDRLRYERAFDESRSTGT